ncbi:MAG: DUF5926 family protein [Bifidobacteriaceae bacterium]|jgi:hypothetical protein|nr:DUF5926 family protein [Bifidobacteriaceae bacterium]
MGTGIKDYVQRPFEGLPGEADWVALHEILPAATATARFNAENGGAEVAVASLLPRVRPAWQRADGTVIVALQTTFSSGDASRDVAQALLLAQAAEPGEAIEAIDIDASGPRLQDVLDPEAPFEITVHPTFDYWKDLETEDAEKYDDAIEEASKALDPTQAAPGLAGAYWTQQNGRPFLRWSLGIEEERLLDALARLHARRESAVVPEARYAGAFRALGLIIPVWELPAGTEAGAVAEPAAAFRARLDQALAATADLTVLERRARAGLVARSVTLR